MKQPRFTVNWHAYEYWSGGLSGNSCFKTSKPIKFTKAAKKLRKEIGQRVELVIERRYVIDRDDDVVISMSIEPFTDKEICDKKGWATDHGNWY